MCCISLLEISRGTTLVLICRYLRSTRWEKLRLVRVYTKPKGKLPDYSSPVVLRTGRCTVEDFVSGPPVACRDSDERLRFDIEACSLFRVETDPLNQQRPQCNAIHRSIVEQFKTAIVYGKSVKHQPQRVGLAHELCDEDIGKWKPEQALPYAGRLCSLTRALLISTRSRRYVISRVLC